MVIFTITEPGADAGVGIATWTPGVAPGSARIPALEGLREPSLARSDGVWQVIGVDDTLGLVRAQSPDLVAWTVDTAAVVPTGATLWAADAVSSPSLSCLDDPSYPWSLHYGGQSGSDTAWGWSVGDSWGTYFVGPETDAWSNGGGWLSFDVIESAVGSLAWFEHLGSDGLPRIGLASIGAPDLTTARDRDCSSAP
ncbi:MAG TPA: hypothetical protein ENK18_08495 [Deltaproteobacteria bacterium]|nr:hypothetical protein [Deltaproteobacteria bacterium]